MKEKNLTPKQKMYVEEYLREYVLFGLMDVAEKCMQADNFNPSSANKSLELIGKHLGMFKDKVEVANIVDIAEELRKRLEKFQ